MLGMLTRMKKLLRLFKRIFITYIKLVAVLGMAYWVMPPVSTLMAAKLLTFKGIEYESVSLKEVHPNVLRAVIRAEDDQFCKHWGIDVASMTRAVERASDGKRSHGASTISMQVAKNLFLWPGRSYIRKAMEIPIALFLDFIWSKRRMMEVYLTVAEWGAGVFGIESAAQHYFKKSAKNLTSYEAALLAAALPNPVKRNPARPSDYHAAYARTIIARMDGGADLSCF